MERMVFRADSAAMDLASFWLAAVADSATPQLGIWRLQVCPACPSTFTNSIMACGHFFLSSASLRVCTAWSHAPSALCEACHAWIRPAACTFDAAHADLEQLHDVCHAPPPPSPIPNKPTHPVTPTHAQTGQGKYTKSLPWVGEGERGGSWLMQNVLVIEKLHAS